MQLRYQYRVYPTPGQQESLARAFGCARVVFNDALAARKAAFTADRSYVSDAELSTRLTAAKTTPERAWLSEVSAVVLQQALTDLNTAYRNFFQSVTGKRKGPKMAPPRFRSRKDNRQSIRFTRNARFAVTVGGKLRLPKIGEVKVAWSRDLPSEPSSVTVIKDASGRYFASFVVEVDDQPLPQVDAEVGIDLGLTTFAVLSNGKRIESPKFLHRAERRLARAQRNLSRKQKGSNNRTKARVKVAKAHVKVADTRRDWAHKHTTAIVRETQTIYVEDLCVKGLARTRLAKSVHDAGWSMFTGMLKEKAARSGRYFGKVDRFYPSSQICAPCGHRDGPKPLSVRVWTCPVCAAVLDRDLNASNNVLAAGRAERLNACRGRVSPGLAPAPADEAGTHRKRPPGGL
ncbi:RNA-guided endonuclease TnpB family protein [Nocardia sp. CDC153]|uniref:RNA-guided endonuclease InsQ/TnpB family protein n=1 Tax=Nocardia sp. CDC153 TaxID=3112167 RepID=UPI002DB6D92E|nr:RNA-guided endonuclease TnpB family protein [Nocardia sp. CDC153]MEC3951431.1 RNA-guided endonuclease TnpB family protein [Nocardia sp. CDC153]